MPFEHGRRFAGRSGPLALCAVVALALVPAAASAAPIVDISLDVSDLLVPTGSSGRDAPVFLYNDGDDPVTLQGASVTVDTTKLSGVATVRRDSWTGCDYTATAVTCPIGNATIPPTGPNYLVGLTLVAASGAKPGQTGTFTVTITASGGLSLTKTATIEIAEATDLKAPGELVREGKPGGPVTFPLTVRNAGSAVIRGASISSSLGSSNGRYVKRFSNCHYTEAQMFCEFDEELSPNTEYALSEPLSIEIRRDAPAPFGYDMYFDWQTVADGAHWLDVIRGGNPVAGTGDRLRLVPKGAAARSNPQTDVKPVDNFTKVKVNITGNNAADQVAVGASVRGAFGANVAAKVGIRNAGPARVDLTTGLLAGVHIVVPAGATVVSLPPHACVPAKDGQRDATRTDPLGAPEYLCWTGARSIEVGETITWNIGLRVTSEARTQGTVTVNSDFIKDAPVRDRNAENNTADIDVNGPVNQQSSGPLLPVTGASVMWTALIGVALIALGAGGYLVTRRRRMRFVA